jgi:PhzF family phenazine biosynthesis protein
MATHVFQQVDVFTAVAFKGNPLAVVIDADGLTDRQMADIANWTNLSETTFLVAPTEPGADYRVRIFTPERELPFAGHPTLGSCHAWLSAGNSPKGDHVVQQCGVGIVRIRRDGRRLAFAAPPLRRSGSVAPDLLAQLARGLRIEPASIRAAQWIDNGVGWVALLLGSRAEVLALRPDFPALAGQYVGVVAPWDAEKDGADADFEVRGFVTTRSAEDPVTGSLNAGLGQWLIGSGLAPVRRQPGHGSRTSRSRPRRAHRHGYLDRRRRGHLHGRQNQRVIGGPSLPLPMAFARRRHGAGAVSACTSSLAKV